MKTKYILAVFEGENEQAAYTLESATPFGSLAVGDSIAFPGWSEAAEIESVSHQFEECRDGKLLVHRVIVHIP